MGLTLLARASLPIDSWDHSFTTAVSLINILPTTALENYVSPFYALHHKQHDYKILKVFGCSCYPHLRPYNHHKLDFKTTKHVNLGVTPTHKGHKCLHPDGRIYVSKDVVFNEAEFPYSTSHQVLVSKASTNTQLPKSLTLPRLGISHIHRTHQRP